MVKRKKYYLIYRVCITLHDEIFSEKLVGRFSSLSKIEEYWNVIGAQLWTGRAIDSREYYYILDGGNEEFFTVKKIMGTAEEYLIDKRLKGLYRYYTTYNIWRNGERRELFCHYDEDKPGYNNKRKMGVVEVADHGESMYYSVYCEEKTALRAKDISLKLFNAHRERDNYCIEHEKALQISPSFDDGKNRIQQENYRKPPS